MEVLQFLFKEAAWFSSFGFAVLRIIVGGLPDETGEDAERERHHPLRPFELRGRLDHHHLPRLQGGEHQGKHQQDAREKRKDPLYPLACVPLFTPNTKYDVLRKVRRGEGCTHLLHTSTKNVIRAHHSGVLFCRKQETHIYLFTGLRTVTTLTAPIFFPPEAFAKETSLLPTPPFLHLSHQPTV